MTNKEILEKAIQKAIEGGWTIHNLGHYIVDDTGTFVGFDNFDINSKNWQSPVTVIKQTEALIFNHDFAKALWPAGEHGLNEVNGHWYEASPYDERSYIVVLNTWEYHLQQMVIADDPIKYLGENI